MNKIGGDRWFAPLLKENNVRVGFFERDQFLAVLAHLPEPVRPAAIFAYITGWRIDSEVLSLEWRQVDFGAGEVRLDPGKTKNGEGRTFPMPHELGEMLEQQRAITENLQRQLKVVRAVPPLGSAHQELPGRIPIGLHGSWMPGTRPTRLPQNRRPESRPCRHPGAGRGADDRAQDPERVRAIQYRERRRPS